MKLIQSVPWLASTSLFLIAALPTAVFTERATTAEELKFQSVEGRKLEKRFVQHSELDLVDTKFVVEGPDGPQEQESGDDSFKIIDDETLEFLDETLSAGDGQPKKAKRSFATIENSVNFESDAEDFEPQTMKNESGLLGKDVTFTWDSEDKEFTAAWSEGEGDDDLLEALVEDADFRAWLPGKKVDEGDTWTIPVAEFNNMQEPSGPMGYQREGEEEEEDDSMSEGLRESRKGELKATYKGTRDEDGHKVGVIAFEGKLSTSFETESEADGATSKQSTEQADELEGELLWDLASGHFRALTCDSAIKLTTVMNQSFEIEGQSFKLSQSQSFEGKKTYRFTCSQKKD